MTDLLEQAFQQARKLPVAEQNAFAERVLAELRADERWDKLFDESIDVLEKLAAEARAMRERRETIPLDIERLG